MNWRQVMNNHVRTAGALGQELRNACRELITSIRSIDRDRMPNPEQIIRELRRILRTIVSAGTVKLGELWEEIKELKDAITKITKEQMPDMRDVFGSIGEWWWDLKNTMHGMFSDIDIKFWEQIGQKARNAFKDRGNLTIDKAAEIIAALGVPGLVLVMLIAASPWYGAAAMTSSLAILGGPLGMAGGLAALPVLTLIAILLTRFGFEQVFQAVLIKLIESGKTREEILEIIDSYRISKELKNKLREYIDKHFEENDIENGEEENDLEDNEEEDNSEQ